MTTYTPSEAAERSGFSIDTLRYYEREGILPSVERTTGGQRRYTDDDLGRLAFLRCLRDTGMPIAQLRRYAELSTDESALPERVALLQEHEAVVTRQIAELQGWRERLQDKIGWYRGEIEARAEVASR